MPVGVIINALSVVIGGILGTVLRNKLNSDFKEKINMVFGCCSMAMGISAIVLMQNMPAVVLAVILGTMFGLAVHLGDRINQAGSQLQRIATRIVIRESGSFSDDDFHATLLTAIVLFCASGTGIYGSLIAGMNGDNSVLFAKSFLDLFTAMIFACSLGPVVSLIAVPQFFVLLILYLLGGLIIPHMSPAMVADFKACGGFLMLATGFRMVRLKMFPIADMLPAMILVMPVSMFWTSIVLPTVAALGS